MIVRARFRAPEELAQPKAAASSEARAIALAYFIEDAVKFPAPVGVAELLPTQGRE